MIFGEDSGSNNASAKTHVSKQMRIYIACVPRARGARSTCTSRPRAEH